MPPISEHSLRIQERNDRFRTTFEGGTVTLTRGLASLPVSMQERIFAAVQAYTSFNRSNDPNGLHDYGAFTLESHDVVWKIEVTKNGRYLVIMLTRDM